MDPELVTEEEEMEVEGTQNRVSGAGLNTEDISVGRLGDGIRKNRRTTITTRRRHAATRTGKSTST